MTLDEKIDRTRMKLWLAVIFKKPALAEEMRAKLRKLCSKIAKREKG